MDSTPEYDSDEATFVDEGSVTDAELVEAADLLRTIDGRASR